MAGYRGQRRHQEKVDYVAEDNRRQRLKKVHEH